ncbi:MAG: OsmC family protein, partial [Pedobacter sp.]
KEELNDIKISIKATRKEDEVPAIFDVIDIQFNLFGNLSTQKVERALQMTFDKYCSVSNILGRSATINFTYTINKV